MEKNFFSSKSPKNSTGTIYLVFGAPFSGKYKILSQINNYPNISRNTKILNVENLITNDSEIESYLDNNLEVLDTTVVQLIIRHIEDYFDNDLSIIIPDFPINVNQVKLLHKQFSNIKIIDFEISFMNILKKYSTSVYCKSCDEYFSKKVGNRCPKCENLFSTKPGKIFETVFHDTSNYMTKWPDIKKFAKCANIIVETIDTTNLNNLTIREFYTKL